MTVIAMTRLEIDRLHVMRDLATDRITAAEAARLMGVSRRHVFRLAIAYRTRGVSAFVSSRRGKPSNRSYPPAFRTEAIALVRANYADFGPTLACEKLAERHGITLGVETLRQWMLAEGLWADRRQRLKPVYDQDAPVRSHREAVAQRLGRLGGADRHHQHLGRVAGFLLAQRPLDGDLVEGVHRHLDVGEVHPGAVGLDPDLHVVVDETRLTGTMIFMRQSPVAGPPRSRRVCRRCSDHRFFEEGLIALDPLVAERRQVERLEGAVHD